MVSEYLIKTLALFAIISAILSGCRKNPGANETGERPSFDPPTARVPFSTREPEIFQAEIVVTSGDTARSTFVARNGQKHRAEFDFGTRARIAYVFNERSFIILPEMSKFAESPAATPFSTDDWNSFLTTRWLNEKTEAKFEKLESPGGSSKYRVKFGDAGLSEVIVTIDETNGIVVKQEFFSIIDGAPRQAMTVETKSIKLTADESLFAIPNGFEKVEPEEILRLKRGLENKDE